MKILNYLSLLFIFAFNFLYSSELDKFYTKYALPQEIISTLDFNDDRALFRNYLEPFAKHPQYFLKDEQIGRIINAERMRLCIAAHNLTCFDAPQKYLYKDGNKIRVLADTVDRAFISELTLEETQQLVTLIEKTGYCDMHTGNVLRDRKTEKLVIIDTENSAFVKDQDAFSYFYKEDPLGVFNFFRINMRDFMNRESRIFVDMYLSKDNTQQHQEAIENFIPIPSNTNYDAQIGIDFEQVKREFKATRAQ